MPFFFKFLAQFYVVVYFAVQDDRNFFGFVVNRLGAGG